MFNTRSIQKDQKQAVVHEQESKQRPYSVFRFQGHTAAVYTGAVTQKKYRFHFNGETRLVDYRDAPAFLGEPLLKQVFLP